MLKCALVGCGRIAKRHSELLGGNQIAGARLVAVCDIVAEKAERIGRTFSVPFFTDMHEMMRTAAIDVVVDLQNALAVRVDIQVTAEHTPEFVAHDTAEELIRAVDGAMAKMEQQLRKHKEKVHGHKGQGSDKGNGIIAEPESEEEAVEQE